MTFGGTGPAWTRVINFLALSLASGVSALAQVNVLTANYDLQRTNSNTQEVTLNISNVNGTTFGRLGAFPVDGQIYAQPLYVSGLQLPNGTHNVVFVATMHNSVYAIDGDQPQITTPLWEVNLGPSVPSSALNYTDALPETGILSTPVIDLDRQAIYVITDTYENSSPVFRIHALSLLDGHEMLNGPEVIATSVNGANGTVPFDASQQLQRPGLALANGMVYAGFGSHGDSGNFHGWLFAYDASNLQHLVSVLNTSPDGYGASIWQAGRAPAVDGEGNVYVVTGNGSGPPDYGESLLKLSGQDLSVLYAYTAGPWSAWNDQDLDFGSTGTILLSDANLVITGSKAGELFLLNPEAARKRGPGDPSAARTVQANSTGMFDFALWNSPGGPTVYLLEPWGPLKAFQIVNGQINPTPFSQNRPAITSAYCGLAVSSNGGTTGTGIVWETTGNYNLAQTPGTLHAFDASDLTQELWNSDMLPDRDALGRFAKFVAPTVANGRVYVPTFSNQLVTYGLLDGSGPIVGPPQISGVVNGASLLDGPVSPGEIVSIFGANLGPTVLAGLQTDSAGNVTTSLSGTQVTFDGTPAPLIFSSNSTVGAVVPFGVAGPTTQVQLQYQGQTSFPVTVPVAAAAPALFSLDGSGGGQGEILNADGSVNSWSNPAAPGSVVTLYATGAGQMNPPEADGSVPGNPPFAVPVLGVTVSIGDQPAGVLYAGAAPGSVAGVLQINVRIPRDATSGSLPVALQVGDYSTAATITVAVQ